METFVALDSFALILVTTWCFILHRRLDKAVVAIGHLLLLVDPENFTDPRRP